MSIVFVSGAIANKLHQGGEAWVRLSYVLGLQRLGFKVVFIETIPEESCCDAADSPCDFESSSNLAYFRRVMSSFGLSDASILVPTVGGKANVSNDLIELATSAAALLNISGHLQLSELTDRLNNRVYVDIDPGYTQYWHAGSVSGGKIAEHDWYFTIGYNIGSADCPIPTCGLTWQATRPPVVLDHWPVTPVNQKTARFTTVANWRGAFGPVTFDGKSYGLKAHEFRKFIELPKRCDAQFEIALNIHPADAKDRMALEHHGWHITDPAAASHNPAAFQSYIQQSSAEFSVAQGIYVDTHSGWFSDRTVRYLAAGKPALVQDTGFSQHIPTGLGLVAFRSLDEAVAGAQAICSNYEQHSRAAREIAEHYFDSDKVLRDILERIGL